ncbi:(Fe-S)-binding protein [Chloroflexota bacterium]
MSIKTPECHSDGGWYRIAVDLQDDISEVLPYLNAELRGFDYNHDAKILLCTANKKSYAFRSHEIMIAPVENREEALILADNMVSTVNSIWNRRNTIEPNFRGKPRLPNVLDIYKLLPGTNCKECGSSTCMSFAVALRIDSNKTSLCPYIQEQAYFNLVSSTIAVE